MIKTIGIGLFMAVVGITGTLRAQAGADCKKIAQYVEGHMYHRDDLVWLKRGVLTREYRCKDTFCGSSPAVSRSWEDVAECQPGTP